MNNFELEFTNFLRKYCPNAEIVSDILDKNVRNFQNADYLFNNRKFIVELKCLEKEKYLDVHNILQDLLNKREIPYFKKGMTIEEVLKDYPEKDKVKEKIYKKITSSLRGALKKANRQIRETRVKLNIKDSQGLVFFLNLDNIILEPKIAHNLINKLLLQKDIYRQYRYKELNLVIYVSEVHFQQQLVTKGNVMPFIVIIRKDKLNDSDWIFLNDFRNKWSKFRSIPVTNLEEATIDGLNSIPFLSKEKDFESMLGFNKKGTRLTGKI